MLLRVLSALLLVISTTALFASVCVLHVLLAIYVLVLLVAPLPLSQDLDGE